MKRDKLDRYRFYPTAEECAAAAAPIFKRCRWRWSREVSSSMGFIPDTAQLIENLIHLRNVPREGDWVASGRLVHSRKRGFGHQRPETRSSLL